MCVEFVCQDDWLSCKSAWVWFSARMSSSIKAQWVLCVCLSMCEAVGKVTEQPFIFFPHKKYLVRLGCPLLVKMLNCIYLSFYYVCLWRRASIMVACSQPTKSLFSPGKRISEVWKPTQTATWVPNITLHNRSGPSFPNYTLLHPANGGNIGKPKPHIEYRL